MAEYICELPVEGMASFVSGGELTEGIGFSVAPSDFCAWGERRVVDE